MGEARRKPTATTITGSRTTKKRKKTETPRRRKRRRVTSKPRSPASSASTARKRKRWKSTSKPRRASKRKKTETPRKRSKVASKPRSASEPARGSSNKIEGAGQRSTSSSGGHFRVLRSLPLPLPRPTIVSNYQINSLVDFSAFFGTKEKLQVRRCK